MLHSGLCILLAVQSVLFLCKITTVFGQIETVFSEGVALALSALPGGWGRKI